MNCTYICHLKQIKLKSLRYQNEILPGKDKVQLVCIPKCGNTNFSDLSCMIPIIVDQAASAMCSIIPSPNFLSYFNVHIKLLLFSI